MMAKDSVKKRLEREGSGMSFTEFTYQLIQGNDFVELYKKYGCKLQIGGSDQFGNGTTGIELIHKMLKKDDACVLTWPLVTKADGTKFGKSEKGNVWLDPEKTTPYEFYQFWLNQSDVDSERFIKMFTLIDVDTIKSLIEEHRKSPEKRLLQNTLAKYMTCLVHSEEAYNKAIDASKILFGGKAFENGAEALSQIESVGEEAFISAMKDVPTVEASKEQFVSGVSVVDLAAMHEKVPSKSEARKLIKSNGFAINKVKPDSEKDVITSPYLIHGKYLLLQKGKKDYTLVKAV
jgi:tyrosyl-tRNA synthetase